MLSEIFAKIKVKERAWKAALGGDIATPEGRRRARLHANLIDHAFLRRILPNRYRVTPDVWRSNQPDPVHFPKLREIGIKTILNLRGDSPQSYFLFEQEACRDYEITLINLPFQAVVLASGETYIGLLDQIRAAKKPMLIHCKSGADRTGLAMALYLLDEFNVDIEVAKKQLSIKYAHQAWSKAGILDHLLDCYQEFHNNRPITIRDWLANEYDRDVVTASFEAKRRS